MEKRVIGFAAISIILIGILGMIAGCVTTDDNYWRNATPAIQKVINDE